MTKFTLGTGVASLLAGSVATCLAFSAISGATAQSGYAQSFPPPQVSTVPVTSPVQMTQVVAVDAVDAVVGDPAAMVLDAQSYVDEAYATLFGLEYEDGPLLVNDFAPSAGVFQGQVANSGFIVVFSSVEHLAALETADIYHARGVIHAGGGMLSTSMLVIAGDDGSLIRPVTEEVVAFVEAAVAFEDGAAAGDGGAGGQVAPPNGQQVTTPGHDDGSTSLADCERFYPGTDCQSTYNREVCRCWRTYHRDWGNAWAAFQRAKLNCASTLKNDLTDCGLATGGVSVACLAGAWIPVVGWGGAAACGLATWTGGGICAWRAYARADRCMQGAYADWAIRENELITARIDCLNAAAIAFNNCQGRRGNPVPGRIEEHADIMD